MKDRVASVSRLIVAGAGGVSERARWSFADQVLISGTNVLTTILLVRALGLHDFGVYSMVMIGVQFVANIQSGAIIAPLMSKFDQRGHLSSADYLVGVLFHQLLFAAVTAVALLAAYVYARFVLGVSEPVNLGLVISAAILTQLQDLIRRFLYVTERPSLAFAGDAIAYGVRFVLLLGFALAGALTVDATWVIVIVTSALALAPLAADLRRLKPTRASIESVTTAHKTIAAWMVANNFVGWFSEINFFLLVIGAAIGVEQLGAVRAVQSVILVVNLVLQSLENFVPSGASKALQEQGGGALLRYVTRVSILGGVAILAVTVLLMMFADPIMLLVYGRDFSNQLEILGIMGCYLALSHVIIVVTAGLRALENMRAAFVGRVAISAIALVAAWLVAKPWGVVGALLVMLIARAAFTGQLALLLKKKAQTPIAEREAQ